MDSIGAEVGQKMRSAIKAKLMELKCYVDDELPDYIMVMVANKRTKSQMNEDLNLFLSTKTSTFVNWLHIVLKKLKEVTVTNPEVYKKVVKRKSTDEPDVKVKKEKKDKSKKIKKEGESSNIALKPESSKSLTDDLPITANKLSEQRKIILLNENKSSEPVIEDNFDIPLLSEVNASNERELEDIEKKIKSVKSRLGLLVKSDDEDGDCLNLKTEKEELLSNEREEKTLRDVLIEKNKQMCLGKQQIVESTTPERTEQHSRIVFEESTTPPRKPLILERLGKRTTDSCGDVSNTPPRKKIVLSEYRREEEKYLGSRNGDKDLDKRQEDWDAKRRSQTDNSGDRSVSSRERQKDSLRDISRREPRKESIHSRLGVKSKVSVPEKPPEEPEEEEPPREVPSLIKVKPRVIPADAPQPNKTLLLKAVAEAQRSIAQAPKVGANLRPDALFTKKYREKTVAERNSRKLPQNEKHKLRDLISKSKVNSKYSADSDNYDSDGEYIPKPIKKPQSELPEYVPSSKKSESEAESDDVKQQFIITLDGIEKTKFAKTETKIPVKARLEGRKTPSPIIFDKEVSSSTSARVKPNVPDRLPLVHPPLSVKNKERCKYWPNCRQGDKCEFAHPTTNCENFPSCKFGEICIFIHPPCKFGSSCTKRDCPYWHANKIPKNTASRTGSRGLPPGQVCKFFPNCSNMNCTFYHPKLCKYGKYCKNQADCTFSHAFIPNKTNLSWRSK